MKLPNLDYFFTPDLTEESQEISLSSDESHHLQRVSRKRVGEQIGLTSGCGMLATATIVEFQRRSTICMINQVEQSPTPEPRIELALGIIRPKRLDWAVEKLTELGVSAIQPLFTEHTNAKHLKFDHLERICISAMKQSGQAFLPEVKEGLPFDKWFTRMQPDDLYLLAHPAETAATLKSIDFSTPPVIKLAIGPEGGFSQSEVENSIAAGVRPVLLGDTILRAETAAVVAMAQLKLFLQM